MKNRAGFRWAVILVPLLTYAVFLLAQQGLPAKRALVINGHSVPDAVVQINGHSFADIEAIAEATHATLKFLPDRVLLTLPEENGQLPPPQAVVPQMKEGITREFARAALAQLSSMREWKDAVIRVIKAGEPAGTKLQDYRDRAVESLRLASVSAITNSDQNALQLLRNEFAYMQQWDAGAMVANRAMSGEQAVNPNFPQNDAMVTRISDCHSFLNTMIVSGVFADSMACH
ncbi:MAG: hypothetical protein LAP21_16130 [Acidobacteriia bacterium]|nr:hypothetical protein [Terriglobia bacterium]